MRHRFHIDTDRDIRLHPVQFNRLVESMISSDSDFIVTRQSKTISGNTVMIIVGDVRYILDTTAPEGLA